MNTVLRTFLELSRFNKRLVAVGSDALFLLFSFWAAFALRLDMPFWRPTAEQFLLALATTALTVLVFIRLGLYRAIIRFLGDRAVLSIVVGVSTSCALLVILGYLMNAALPRSVPFIYGALALLFVAGTRLTVRAVVNNASRTRKKPLVGIIGAGETGVALCEALNRGTEHRPAFFVSFKPENRNTFIHGLPVISLDEVEKMRSTRGVSRLLLALDHNTTVDRRALLKSLEPLNIPVQTVPSTVELMSGRARINDIRELAAEDLLGRDPVRSDNDIVASGLRGKAVLVSGAGGSIGSELCRQILRHRPRVLVLFELSEYALYAIERELSAINILEGLEVSIHTLLGSVTHRRRCETVMRVYGIQTVYHAAAYKHVPLVEYNIIEGVQNNVFGTWHMAEAAVAAGVERFVLISTDKAVRPTNVMGASKRLAELVLQGLAQRQSDTHFSMVRFGNVLGSSGSVVPLFRDQVRDGGPVTVTHPDIIRYFMTIPEASQLVLQAGSMGRDGEVFVLDMGEPVKIADLARKIIRLMGFTEKSEDAPDGDIEIVYTGLRPGEKLYEELLIGENPQGTIHPRIMKAREVCLPWQEVHTLLMALAEASSQFDCERVVHILESAPTGYRSVVTSDLVWLQSRAERLVHVNS